MIVLVRSWLVQLLVVFAITSNFSVSVAEENGEWFVGVATGIEEPLRSKIVNRTISQVFEKCEAGDVVHVFELPEQKVLLSTTVIDGPKALRSRRTEGKKVMASMRMVLKPDTRKSLDIDLPSVSATVESLRRTEFTPLIVLAGDPIYSGFPHHAGWSMKTGLVPTDTALVDGQLSHLSPFVGGVADFPAGAKLAILAHRSDWGYDRMHEAAVVRAMRIMCQESGGAELIRVTDDADAAFNLTGNQRYKQVTPNDSEEFGLRTTFWQSAQDGSADYPAVIFLGNIEEKPPMLRVLPPAEGENKSLFTTALESDEHVLVAIRWQADSSNLTCTDVDVRVTADGEEIAFDAPTRNWGSLVKDVRYGLVSPPGKDLWGDNWEGVLIDKNYANRVKVWANNYVGIGNLTIQVATIGNGRVRTGRFTIKSRTGDEARESAKRSESKRWVQIPLPLEHSSSIAALLSEDGPPKK